MSQPVLPSGRGPSRPFGWLLAALLALALLGAALLLLGVTQYDAPALPPLRQVTEQPSLL